MNQLRYTDVKLSIARVLNVDVADPIVIQYTNEAERRLVNKGTWRGTNQRYRICSNSDGCLTWPRQVDTILAYWLCDTPGTIRNGWYEANINGPGYLDSQDSPSWTLVDRGTSPVFNQPLVTTATVMVQSDTPEDPSARILLRGYNAQMQWIRTQDPPASGNYIDGEYVQITSGATFSVNVFTSITSVIKPPTNGAVRLWQYDTALVPPAVTRQIAYYEPDETLPIYRCSLIPGLGNQHGCASCSSTTSPGTTTACQPNRITVIVKLRHIDVVNDNDLLLLGNLGALKLEVMAILKEERNLLQESALYEAKALKELNDELTTYEGEGVVPTIKTESPQTWGAGVLNSVTLGYRVYW